MKFVSNSECSNVSVIDTWHMTHDTWHFKKRKEKGNFYRTVIDQISLSLIHDTWHMTLQEKNVKWNVYRTVSDQMFLALTHDTWYMTLQEKKGKRKFISNCDWSNVCIMIGELLQTDTKLSTACPTIDGNDWSLKVNEIMVSDLLIRDSRRTGSIVLGIRPAEGWPGGLSGGGTHGAAGYRRWQWLQWLSGCQEKEREPSTGRNSSGLSCAWSHPGIFCRRLGQFL
jgi:hypothetical protein